MPIRIASLEDALSLSLDEDRTPHDVPRPTFAQVLRRARMGDENARNALVELFYADVRRLVHHKLSRSLRRHLPRLASLFSTRDIVQDVFLAVLQEIERFEGEDERAFKGFLATAVTNRLIDMLRHHQAARRDVRRSVSATATAGPQLAGDETSPTAAIERLEEVTAVQEAIETLSKRDRALIEMRFRNEAQYGEIAEALDIPTADAARKAVCAAQARLLMHLRRRGIR